MDDTPVLTETPEEIAYELRAAEEALWTGSRLVIGIAAFALASLAFAYFYLRSANSENLWRPNGITAPTAIGAAIFVVTLASALLHIYGTRHLNRGLDIDFQVAGWASVAGGLLATGLQIWQLTKLTFYPGSSGYASCFVAWAVMNVTMVLSATYWTETLLARSLRLRKSLTKLGGSAQPLPAVRQFRANATGSAYYWGFVGIAATLFWLLYYVI